MEMITGAAAPCPCCTFIDADALIGSIAMRKSEESLLYCKACSTMARERASEVEKDIRKGGKGSKPVKPVKGQKGQAAAGGGGAKQSSKAMAIIEAAKSAASASAPATFVCMTCGHSCCPEHALTHFMESGKKRSKSEKQRHREHHCVFFNTRASEASVSDFRCYCVACDLPVGNLPIPEDCDYNGVMDGIAINREGYIITGDEDYLTEPCIALSQALAVAHDGKSNPKLLRKKLGRHGDPKKMAKMAARAAKDERRKRMMRDGGGYYIPGSDGGGHSNKSNPGITERGIVGLTNLGNTCFFNSTLQCLLQLRSVRDRFGFITEAELPGPLCMALRRTFTHVEADAPAGAVVVPRMLFSQLCQRNAMFAEFGQQDAQDLLLTLVNGVYDEYEVRAKRDGGACTAAAMMGSLAAASSSSPGPGGEAGAFSCFGGVGGELNYTITCHDCKAVYQRKEHVLDINLSTHGCHSVADALRHFFTPQVLSGDNAYLCEKCCKEEYEQKRRADEAMLRQREELAQRMVAEMEAQGGLGADTDEILKPESDDDDGEEDDEEEESDDDDDGSDASSAGGDEKSEQSSRQKTPQKPQKKDEDEIAVVVEQQQQPSAPPKQEADVVAEQKEQQPEKKKEEPSSSSSAGSKKYVDATCEASISSVRDVVVLHLKRFSLNWQAQRWEKDNTPCAFTSTLDLSEFGPPSVAADQRLEEKEIALLMSAYPQHSPDVLRSVLEAAGGSTDVAMSLLEEGIDLQSDKSSSAAAAAASSSSLKYRLSGVVQHEGRVDGGHYVSYFRSVNTGQWYHASDSWVRASSEQEALSSQAYLLFYERQ